MKFFQWIPTLRKPVLASLLKSRMMCILISLAAFLQLSLVAFKLPAWQSPLHTLLGFPDPGCGLTRAMVALLRGDWVTSLTYHAFAPFFLAALGIIAVQAVLPDRMGEWVVNWIDRTERRTGVTSILLVALIVYWLARLLIMREAFIKLISG